MVATCETSDRPVSNRQVVKQAITDLCTAGRQASRQAICDFTGLKMSIVDDHVKNLKDDGEIRLVVNGIFELVDQTPDRAVWGGITAEGRYKMEVGDVVLDLTLREARNIGLLTGGLWALQGR